MPFVHPPMPSFIPSMENVPVLDLGDQRGNTGYIDFVKAEDVQFPVMRGIDVYGRPFVAIKAQLEGKCEFPEVVGVFFQRYADNTTDWAYGSCYPLNLLFHDSRVSKIHMEGLKSRLSMLMSGGKVRNVEYGLRDSIDWVNGNGSIRLFLETGSETNAHIFK